MIRKSTMLKLTWIVVVSARLCAADPRIGAWKLVSADSALDPRECSSLRLKGKGVHVVILGSTHLDFTAAWTDMTITYKISAFNQIVMRQDR